MRSTAVPVWLSLVLASIAFTTGCSPSLSPLYRDFEVEPPAMASVDATTAAAQTSVHDRIRAALVEAGWTIEEQDYASNVVATEQRTTNHWGLYRVVLSLEAAPVGEHYVRLYFHPYRKYVFGRRSKIPFLPATMRRTVLPDLAEAFEAQGLVLIGTPRQRDRAATTR